ncbi:formin-like protein 16 [Teleopsis dalmanni]|uniref:formin-like protein 16 n=1 Tax=Teleopsis dalmanni TaxID=139649 RepID=UPI0018CF5C36|nr:formin-like protein 16 [Teleopsis dalmanni]
MELTRENFRAMIYYDFQGELARLECINLSPYLTMWTVSPTFATEQARADSMDYSTDESDCIVYDDPDYTTDVEDVSRLNWSAELMNEKLRRKPELRKGMGPERPPQPAPCSPGAQERKDREDREYVAKCMFGVKEVENIQNLNLSSSPQRPQEEDLPWGLTSRAERVCGRKGSNKRVFNVPRRWKYRRPPSSPMCGVPLPGRGPAASTPQEFTSPPARSSDPSPCPSPCPPSPASPCPSAAAAPCPSSAQGAVGGRPLTSPVIIILNYINFILHKFQQF